MGEKWRQGGTGAYEYEKTADRAGWAAGYNRRVDQ